MLGSQALLGDGQRAAHRKNGIGEPICVHEKLSKVGEVGGNIWMVRPQVLLGDLKRTPQQRLGLAQPVGGFQKQGKVVMIPANSRVFGTKVFLVDG